MLTERERERERSNQIESYCVTGIFYRSRLDLYFLSHLVSWRLVGDGRAAPDHDEGVEEVALDAGGREAGVVGLKEHHAHDVVANVAFALELK